MLKTKIESLLFISNKPLTYKKIASFLKKTGEETKKNIIEEAVEELKQRYNFEESGVRIIQSGEEVQMVTSPEASQIIKDFVKEEMTGELTPASLETLTVVAYRGPISKAELEKIRGVNCSLILRNLSIRGLVTAEENKEKMQTYYQVTTDFLKYLGIDETNQLPDFERLNKVENLEDYLNQNDKVE